MYFIHYTLRFFFVRSLVGSFIVSWLSAWALSFLASAACLFYFLLQNHFWLSACFKLKSFFFKEEKKGTRNVLSVLYFPCTFDLRMCSVIQKKSKQHFLKRHRNWLAEQRERVWECVFIWVSGCLLKFYIGYVYFHCILEAIPGRTIVLLLCCSCAAGFPFQLFGWWNDPWSVTMSRTT